MEVGDGSDACHEKSVFGSAGTIPEHLEKLVDDIHTPIANVERDHGDVVEDSRLVVNTDEGSGSRDVGVRVMEQRIRKAFKKDSFSIVEGMRREPLEKSSMCIPLCRLVHMPMVRPTLRSDVTKLMGAFQFGYRSGSAVLYVSPTDENGKNRIFSAKDKREWGEMWAAENDKFEAFLRSDRDLKSLCGRMFYVYDGNHRLLAWKEFIETEHRDDPIWYSKHGCPECVVLDTSGGRGDILTAMHDINRYFS